MKRWRGLKSLVQDAVEHGSTAIQTLQLETARRPFAILEHLPPLAAPAKLVHALHDVAVTGVHETVRAVTRGVGAGVDAALDVIERRDPRDR
jgi:hypothetical protein